MCYPNTAREIERTMMVLFLPTKPQNLKTPKVGFNGFILNFNLSQSNSNTYYYEHTACNQLYNTGLNDVFLHPTTIPVSIPICGPSRNFVSDRGLIYRSVPFLKRNPTRAREISEPWKMFLLSRLRNSLERNDHAVNDPSERLRLLFFKIAKVWGAQGSNPRVPAIL